ncbi:MAG: hypothetical protein R2712_08430 [Vicinamibacterales bacterium]
MSPATWITGRVADAGPAITARDQTILAHVPDAGVRHARAAPRGGAIDALSKRSPGWRGLGLVMLQPVARDGRGKAIMLTDAGREALSETSVLETAARPRRY